MVVPESTTFDSDESGMIGKSMVIGRRRPLMST